MPWNSETKVLADDPNAASAAPLPNHGNHHDDKRWAFEEECETGHWATLHIGSMPETSSEELTRVTSPASAIFFKQPVNCQPNARSWGSAEDGVGSDVDKISQQKTDPESASLILKEEHRCQSGSRAASTRSSLALDALQSLHETQAIRDQNTTGKEDAESDSGSEFEWRPVKRSNTRENKLEWEDSEFSAQLQDNHHDGGRHPVKVLEGDSKQDEEKEKKPNELPLPTSSLLQTVDGPTTKGAKGKHSTGRLSQQFLSLPPDKEKAFTHHRTGSSGILKKSALPRPHSGKHSLPVSEMDDVTYLTVFGIEKILSNLALVLLGQKPKDHVAFTKRWIETLIVVEREGEKREGIDRQKSHHFRHYYGKRARSKYCSSPGPSSLSIPAIALSSTCYAGGAGDAASLRSDQLTKRRLKEVLKAELDAKRGTCTAHQHHSISSVTEKLDQNQNKARSRRTKSELRRDSSQASENSDKCNHKIKRCFSKAKISDKVNDYLNKVELTSVSSAAGVSPISASAPLVNAVNTPSPLSLNILVPSSESGNANDMPPVSKSGKCWPPFKHNDCGCDHSSPRKGASKTDEEKENDSKLVLSRTVDPDLVDIPSPIEVQPNITTVAPLQTPVSPNAVVENFSIADRSQETASLCETEQGKDKGLVLGHRNRISEANSYEVSPSANTCLVVSSTERSDPTVSSLKDETRVEVSKLASFFCSPLAPSQKSLDERWDEDLKEGIGDTRNAMATFAPVITLDESISGTVGGLLLSSESKAGSTNNVSLPPTSGQAVAAPAVSTMRVSGARNAGKETVANTRNNILNSATADIPAKLLAAIAPTTISNANRAAQQKLANSGISVSTTGSTTGKHGGAIKVPLAATSSSLETTLAASRNPALNSGFNQGTTTTTIGTARLKLHSLASGSDTMANKSKLPLLRGAGDHCNPSSQLTPPPQPLSPSASPLAVSQSQPHTFQSYSNNLGMAFTANQNAVFSSIFPMSQPSLYASESIVDGKVDPVPFSSIECTDKAATKGDNLPCKITPTASMDLGIPSGAGAVWTRCTNPVPCLEDETKTQGMVKQNSLTDIDALSPRVSSMLTGSNAARAMGLSSSTAFHFSSLSSLMKHRSESVSAGENGCFECRPDRFFPSKESSSATVQKEVLTQIKSTLSKVPKEMYSKVLSYLEVLVGKKEEGDTNGSEFSPLESTNGTTGCNASTSFQFGSQSKASVNFSNAMRTTDAPVGAAFSSQQSFCDMNLTPSLEGKSKALLNARAASRGMHHASSCPTLDLQWENASGIRCNEDSFLEGKESHVAVNITDHYHFSEICTNAQACLQANINDVPFPDSTQSPLLGLSTAMGTPRSSSRLNDEQIVASSNRISSLQSRIQSFDSIDLCSQSQASVSASPPSQGLFHTQKFPGADYRNASIKEIHEKMIPLHDTSPKQTVLSAHSSAKLDAMLRFAGSSDRKEKTSPQETHGLSETDNHECILPCHTRSSDWPTDEKHNPEVKTDFDRSLISKSTFPSPVSSKSLVTEPFRAATVAEASEDKSRNPNLQTGTEGTQMIVAKNDFQSNTHGQLEGSSEGNDARMDNSKDLVRYIKERECNQRGENAQLEEIGQPNRDLAVKEVNKDFSAGLRSPDSKQIIGHRQLTTELSLTHHEWHLSDGTPINSSRPLENEVTRLCAPEVSEKRSGHENEDTIPESLDNSVLKGSPFSKPECALLPTSVSHLAATDDAIGLHDMHKTYNERRSNRSVSIFSSQCSENDARSTKKSPEFFRKFPVFLSSDVKVSHRHRHSCAHSATPKSAFHHHSHWHHHKNTVKDTIKHQNPKSACSEKLIKSRSNQDMDCDNVEHLPLSMHNNSLQRTEAVDSRSCMTPFCQLYNPDSDVFPIKASLQSGTSKKKQSRSVSLSFGNKIFSLSKSSPRRKGSRSPHFSRKKRSSSLLSCVTRLKHTKDDVHHEKQQCCQREHSKFNANSFCDQLSEGALGDPLDATATSNVSSAHDRKFFNAHHTCGKHASHSRRYRSPKSERTRHQRNSQSNSCLSGSKDCDRSLLDLTMDFLIRKGHLEASNCAPGDTHEAFSSLRSPLCALSDAPSSSPNVFVRSRSEKGAGYDLKLDYAIAMTALAVAEGELSSQSDSETSSDRLLDVADRIYSKEIYLSADRRDGGHTMRYSHGLVNSFAHLTEPMMPTNGDDSTAQSTVTTKPIVEEVASNAEEEQENVCRPAQDPCNSEAPSDYPIITDPQINFGDSVGDGFPLLSKESSSACAEMEKGLFKEGTNTPTATDSTSKGISLSSEELNSIHEAISKSTILASFDLKHIELLIHAMNRKVLDASDTLVLEGELWGWGIIFVAKGSMSVTSHGKTLRTIESGGFYGEMEFFDNDKWSPVTLASATAPRTTVFFLDIKDYVTLAMSQKSAFKVFVTRFIERIPLFQTCPDPIKWRLADALKAHRIEQGVTFVDQGGSVECLYIVVLGKLNLIHTPKKAVRKGSKYSPTERTLLKSHLIPPELSANSCAMFSNESFEQDYKSSPLREQIDDVEQRWKKPMQTSQHSTDDTVFQTERNDMIGSTGMYTDSPLTRSSESSEGTKSTESHPQVGFLSLSTSAAVSNKKVVSTGLTYGAIQSDSAVDESSLRPQHQKEEAEGLLLPFNSLKRLFSLKCSSGSLVGEVELVFGTKSLFTAQAETALQVARIDRHHFDAIMCKEVLDTFKCVMVVHPMHGFLRKIAPKKMRREMNSIRLIQSIGEGRKYPSEMKTVSSSFSIRRFDEQDDKVSNAVSKNHKPTRNTFPNLAATRQLPRFRGMSFTEKLKQFKGESKSRNKAITKAATTSSHQSHNQVNENLVVSKPNVTPSTPLRSCHLSNTRRVSAGSSLWHHISPNGEMIFLGGRHLYRFPLEALCANNTIIIEIILDGTIIHWNSIAHNVTGYTPFEVIGQSIFDLMSCEESRQKLQTMLKVAKEYAGKWEDYVAAEMNLQKMFSFRQNTGLYQIGVALSIVPSMCSSFSEVFLLVGRESKYHAAANYSADVMSWLNGRMRPQLANFQYYVSYIESKKWVVTPNDALLLRGHLDACMVTVEHLARLSLLTMETMRDSLRPTQLIVPIRNFITEACALVRNTNCNLFCKTDDIISSLKVFLDAEKVLLFLRLLLKDVLNSLEYDPTAHIDIELRVMIIEPECTHFGSKLKPNATQQHQRQPSPLPDHADAGASGVLLLPGDGGNASNPAQSDKPAASSAAEGVKLSSASTLANSGGDFKESKAPLPPCACSTTSNADPDEGIDLQLSSLRRICFELRDNGLTIPLLHSSNELVEEFPSVVPFDSSSSSVAALLTPTSCFRRREPVLAAPYNSPVVSNEAAKAFPQCSPEAKPRFANPRHRGGELTHVERIVSEMGGVLHCFTRPEVEGNAVRVELPLLAIPGSKEEDPEEASSGLVQHVAVPGGRSFTVIVADNNYVHQNHLCKILWSRQHAVVPVRSFEELMRKIKSNTADILIIDPIQIDLDMDDYIKHYGSDPFGDILESTSRMVLVVIGMDFSDWRVQKLLDRNSVIEVPKLGSAALIHIAMQKAEQMVTEMRDEEDRIEQLRSNFTNAVAGRHKIGRLLGKGTFGDVYEVKDTLTNGRMAMKRMRLHQGTVVDEVVQEILAMTSLQHENIIRYFYCEKESDTMLRLYMELAPGGTLRNRIRENPGVGLPFQEIVQRLIGICRGLAYVHSQHYVHCDLKTANLLLGTHGWTKIGDFGTAKQLAPGQKLYKMLGTPQYMAPEVLMADVQQRIGYDYKADVWSVGCIALEMATGLPPFSHIEQSHGMGIIKYLSELTDTPELSPLLSGNPLIYEFVKACLQINPDLRPSAQDLLHFNILQGTDTSIRAERIIRRAEMLYKLNKYAPMRKDSNDAGSNDGFDDIVSELTSSTISGGGDESGTGNAAHGNYQDKKTNLRGAVSLSSPSSKSSYTSTYSSDSAVSSDWSVESLQASIPSGTM